MSRGQLSKYHSPCHAVSYPSTTVRVTRSAIQVPQSGSRRQLSPVSSILYNVLGHGGRVFLPGILVSSWGSDIYVDILPVRRGACRGWYQSQYFYLEYYYTSE